MSDGAGCLAMWGLWVLFAIVLFIVLPLLFGV